MAEPFRGPQMSRRGWLLAGLMTPLFSAKGAPPLIVTFDGDNLHVSSLGVHFLRGVSLTRLKEGSTVEYVVSLALFRDQFLTQFKRSERHFFVSYDVWGTGDVFAVATHDAPVRKATNLSLSATETWCLENVGISPSGLTPDRQFWLQLDLRSVPPRLSSILRPDSVSVDLIELASRRPGADEHQVLRSDPLRLMDLKGAPRRGRAG